MKFPSNKTLAKVCVYVAIGGISSVMYMRHRLVERIRRQDYFRDAFKTLRSSTGAIKLLGEPIKEMGFDLGDIKKNNCDGETAHFEVAVKGSNDRGQIFFWSKKVDDGWKLLRLELEVKSQPDKRFYIVKGDDSNSN